MLSYKIIAFSATFLFMIWIFSRFLPKIKLLKVQTVVETSASECLICDFLTTFIFEAKIYACACMS